ncbi:uncharacterized protein JCM15063_002969 [Sporobolomyces koalae]|uniref:uncharacterized protein n=1 Tax=Sporobolomyces koalae TaxID=500713 RepID=UPI00317AB8D0
MSERKLHVLSEHPLNAEPDPRDLARQVLTPTRHQFHRNHGEILHKDVETYSLSIKSELDRVAVDRQLSFADLETFAQVEVESALACAGNRRIEMNEEKEVEGLQWGGSAILNSRYRGALLRDVLASIGISLEQLQQVEKLHLHFETSQKCEDADYFGSSLPVSLALDPERPVLLATRSNGEPLDEKHGKPCRLVVPGVIGARSVKWLERIILRNRPSDNFYMSSDYKILPPEATTETKQDYMGKVEPLMDLPLNSEICEPLDGSLAEHGPIKVRGYALGTKGTPIDSVKIVIVPLPLEPSSTSQDSTKSELEQIRTAANSIPTEEWTLATLEHGQREKGKSWGWTLFSASLNLPSNLFNSTSDEPVKVALVAYATQTDGTRQELQTPYNLRGVAEASWSVSRIQVKRTMT